MIRTMIAGAACAVVVSACGQAEGPGQAEPVNEVQDAMSSAVGAASVATRGAHSVDDYVSAAVVEHLYEIQAAQVALERSRSPEIRALAQMIVADHGAATAGLRAMAAQAGTGAALPTELDARRKGLLDNLRAASAANFDQTWLNQQIATHREALALHEGFAKNVEESAMTAHAGDVAPKLRMHLEHAEKLDAAG